MKEFLLRSCLVTAILALPTLSACSPTVRVEAPEEPIVINMNVRIEHEIRIKVEREIDDLLEENQDLF